MGKKSNINWKMAPLGSFDAFAKWHKLACENYDSKGKKIGGDPLSAKERWELRPKKTGDLGTVHEG